MNPLGIAAILVALAAIVVLAHQVRNERRERRQMEDRLNDKLRAVEVTVRTRDWPHHDIEHAGAKTITVPLLYSREGVPWPRAEDDTVQLGPVFAGGRVAPGPLSREARDDLDLRNDVNTLA